MQELDMQECMKINIQSSHLVYTLAFLPLESQSMWWCCACSLWVRAVAQIVGGAVVSTTPIEFTTLGTALPFAKACQTNKNARPSWKCIALRGGHYSLVNEDIMGGGGNIHRGCYSLQQGFELAKIYETLCRVFLNNRKSYDVKLYKNDVSHPHLCTPTYCVYVDYDI